MRFSHINKTVKLTIKEIDSFPVGYPRPELPAGYMFLSNRLNGTLGKMGKNGECTFYRVIEID